jgi:hypothetical protein
LFPFLIAPIRCFLALRLPAASPGFASPQVLYEILIALMVFYYHSGKLNTPVGNAMADE